MTNYKIFDSSISSTIPLHSLPKLAKCKSDVHVSVGSPVEQSLIIDWIHDWVSAEGEATLRCGLIKTDTGATRYILRFPGLADFETDGVNLIARPKPRCADYTLCHLLVDQVLPRMWAHVGRLVVHASAVRMPNNRVCLFMGDSGDGKSTIVAALDKLGCQILADDCVELRSSSRGVLVIPSYRGLRLNPDSIAELGLQRYGWLPVAEDNDKRQTRFFSVGGEGFYLDTLYALKGSSSKLDILIKPVAGVERAAWLIRNSFILNIKSASYARQQMALIASLDEPGYSFNLLQFPMDYHSLPKLCETLIGRHGL
ncbi:MAG: hypothetical protein ABJL54_08035 [Halioglobus sp.]